MPVIDEIPTRGPLAALTVPGAVAGWMLAVEAAKAQTGTGINKGSSRLPLHVLFEAAIRHAREGYAVSRSQAQLTVDKYAELETAPGFLDTFLRRRQSAGAGRASSSKPPSPPRWSISPKPASTISIAAMSAARSLPIWSASARLSPAPIWNNMKPGLPNR